MYAKYQAMINSSTSIKHSPQVLIPLPRGPSNDQSAVHQSSHYQLMIPLKAGSRTYPCPSDASDPRSWLHSECVLCDPNTLTDS